MSTARKMTAADRARLMALSQIKADGYTTARRVHEASALPLDQVYEALEADSRIKREYDEARKSGRRQWLYVRTAKEPTP